MKSRVWRSSSQRYELFAHHMNYPTVIADVLCIESSISLCSAMLCLLLSLISFFLVIHDGWCFASRAAIYQGKQSRNVCTMSLFDRIRSAIIRQQPDKNIDRVVQCWDRFATGVGVERYLDSPKNEVLQTADCFVEGLSAMPFHDTETFPWALNLEKHYKEIYAELNASNMRQRAAQRLTFSAESDWLPPRDTSGSAYGPEWKTLGLQDRSVWDEERVLEFPETVRLLKKFDVPSCEVFFAKQGNIIHNISSLRFLLRLILDHMTLSNILR